jgi:hypothetical protein
MSNKYLRKHLTPAAATETTIYTVPSANTAVLSSLRITNRNAAVTSLSVNVFPSGGATAFALLKNYALPSNQTMDAFSGVPCIMETGDILKVTSSAATVDFQLSFLEMDRS